MDKKKKMLYLDFGLISPGRRRALQALHVIKKCPYTHFLIYWGNNISTAIWTADADNAAGNHSCWRYRELLKRSVNGNKKKRRMLWESFLPYRYSESLTPAVFGIMRTTVLQGIIFDRETFVIILEGGIWNHSCRRYRELLIADGIGNHSLLQ